MGPYIIDPETYNSSPCFCSLEDFCVQYWSMSPPITDYDSRSVAQATARTYQCFPMIGAKVEALGQ